MAADTVIQSDTSRLITFVHGDGDHCASFWPEDVADADGPTHLIIGRRASEAALGRLAERWGLNVDQLRAFRDGARIGWRPALLVGAAERLEYLPGAFPTHREAMEVASLALSEFPEAVGASAVRIPG